MNATNLSSLDGDVFSDFNSNYEYPQEPYSITPVVWIAIAEIIKFTMIAASLGASIFLICIISKFERLRTKCNIFILHYAIACTLDTLVVPIFRLISPLLVSSLDNYHVRTSLYCIAEQFNASTTLLIFIFGTAIALYWYLQNVQLEWVNKIPNFQRYFTLALYLLYLIKLCVYIGDCFTENVYFSNLLLALCYVASLIVIMGINVLAYKTKLTEAQLNTKYQLTVSTYIILSHLPLLIYVILYHYMYFMGPFLEYTVYFAEILAASNVVVVVYLLGAKNKHFKSAYNKVFKKSMRRYNEDDLDETSDVDDLETGEEPKNG